MPVGGSNALKSKTLKPRPARNSGLCPAPNLDHTTTTTKTVTCVRSGGVSTQSPLKPREKVSVQVKISLVAEGKQRRPREREKDCVEVQGVNDTKETLRREDTKGDVQHNPVLHNEKSLINQLPGGKCEVRGRRKRVDKSLTFPTGKMGREPSCLRPTEALDFSKLQAREVPGDGHVPETTKERSKQAELQGRRKRVTVRPTVIRRPQTTAVDYYRVENIINGLYDEKCALKMDDIKKKANFINTIVEKEIIMKIHELDDRFSFDILRAGSYYEKLKVGIPNEFDIMVCLKGNNVNKCFEVQVCPIRRATPYLGGFSYLQYQSHKDTSKCWEDLLIDGPSGVGRVLSAHLIVDHFRKLISRRCQKLSQNNKSNVRIEEPTIKGPAVNVRFMSNREIINVDIVLSIEVPTWPSNAGRWGAEYHRWPSRNMIDEIKSKGCHVVPKANNMDDPRYWRLSFSLAEKSLLRARAIDEDKKCYRIVKHIYEVNKKPLEPLCSYFLKTLFLHLRTSGFFRHGRRKLSIIIAFLEELISKVKKKNLQHFFIPDVNLLCNLTDTEASRIVSFLNRILLNFSNIHSAISFFKFLSA
ncbi:cyclic GMP-AMP synthase-like [Actinia tenebrosa]|uniref:Cyclic GMP-AMP synthase-like n=1 Tax=Actinia tenebrosa TaxID=6105 RepID=A0A6P8JBD9_ACTTE|nr:cyclic GMP-AMP synthase-like [Actinia tenebrosa]XP_031574026.1 cyclic GMP-AMP synthase-like [Actinia tenebrosa]